MTHEDAVLEQLARVEEVLLELNEVSERVKRVSEETALMLQERRGGPSHAEQ